MNNPHDSSHSNMEHVQLATKSDGVDGKLEGNEAWKQEIRKLKTINAIIASILLLLAVAAFSLSLWNLIIKNIQLQEEITSLTEKNAALHASYENISRIIRDVQSQVNNSNFERAAKDPQHKFNLSEYFQETKQSIDKTNNQIQQNTYKIKQIMQGVFRIDGRVLLLSGYEYVLTESKLSWNDSRDSCKAKNADLATNGMRNPTLRRLITSALLPEGSENETFWIGLDYIRTEGTYVWMDGEDATTSNPQRRQGQPSSNYSNSFYNHDCVSINSENYFQSINDSCSIDFYGICEKEITAPKPNISSVIKRNSYGYN